MLIESARVHRAPPQDITTVYQKERHEFGRPVNHFAPSDVMVLDEFLPERADYQHIERNPTILDIQAIPMMSETYVRSSRGNAEQRASLVDAGHRQTNRPVSGLPCALRR